MKLEDMNELQLRAYILEREEEAYNRGYDRGFEDGKDAAIPTQTIYMDRQPIIENMGGVQDDDWRRGSEG